MHDHSAYTPRRPARLERLTVRGLPYQLHVWGDASMAQPQRPLLLMFHGWMDVGASFQFVVDELAALEGPTRWIVAPDWRGFGGSQRPGTDSYWFADYLADLDAIGDALSPDAPFDLAGHSMGGNVAMSYAGVRPARVRRLVNLEGFGLPATRPAQAVSRLAQWLDELKTPQRLSSYPSQAAVAARLRKNNPRLPEDKALWLAAQWAAPDASGQWQVLADPAHKRVNPVLYRVDEVLAAWRAIAAPVLWMEGAQTDVDKFWGDRYPRSDFEARLAEVPDTERVVIDDASHMLHHDQPAALAEAIKGFLDR